MTVEFLQLPLTAILDAEVTGIYGDGKQHLPERMRFLRPEVAKSFRQDLGQHVIVSDMLRSAESSLAARRSGRGAQRPGYSGHNYGYSIDLDVDKTIRRLGLKTKRELDGFMSDRGWYCHRIDSRRGKEDWHFNAFLDRYRAYVHTGDPRTAFGLERMINTDFAVYWEDLDPFDVQLRLARLRIYTGDPDGKIGPLSREAIRVFQRAWLLEDTAGKIDIMTCRTLAFVTADRIIS